MKKALITGASSGMGRDMARVLAGYGYELILVARREERLHALAKELAVPCTVLAADLSDLQECKLVYQAARCEELEIVVNNAGFGLFGAFTETGLEAELRMIRTNIMAVHVLTKLFLRDFRAQDHGYILNVASSAGFMAGGPLMSTYYATKSYVLRLTQAVREELRHEGSAVCVCVLCPGPVDTEFNRVADVRFALPGLRSESVAQYAIRGMLSGRGILVPGAAMKLSLAAKHLIPETLLTRITYHFQRRKLDSDSPASGRAPTHRGVRDPRTH